MANSRPLALGTSILLCFLAQRALAQHSTTPTPDPLQDVPFALRRQTIIPATPEPTRRPPVVMKELGPASQSSKRLGPPTPKYLGPAAHSHRPAPTPPATTAELDNLLLTAIETRTDLSVLKLELDDLRAAVARLSSRIDSRLQQADSDADLRKSLAIEQTESLKRIECRLGTVIDLGCPP